jgi:uncharacterized membrane protein
VADTGDADTPLTAAHAFPPPPDMTPAQGLGLLAAMLLVGLSGFASDLVLQWTGVRTFALAMLVVAGGAAAGLASRGPGPKSDAGAKSGAGTGGAATGNPRTTTPGAAPASISTAPASVRPLGPGLVERAAIAVVLVAALATGATLPLLLLPAVIHAGVARLLMASTRDDVSLIERGARLAHPLAPNFIGPYCRRLTAVWSFLFAKSALVIALFALTGDLAAHRAWTLWQFWTLLGVFSVVEFVWRKAWFRYYGRGPLDRLLRRFFPPETTERGRRSQAYLERMRAELGRLAEEERQRRGAERGRASC